MKVGFSRRAFLLGAVSLAAARAQEDFTFSSDVSVVNLLATVRTKKGELVKDLTKDDFVLLENGHPQNIRYFARETDLPLTIGLMVDTSMSQEKVLDSERGASYRFLDQVMRERKDQIFVMQFDLTVQTKQILTSSRSKLDTALSFVNTPTRRQLENQRGGGTVLFDAVVYASDEVMKKVTGRKALILLTDGGDNGSDGTVADAIDAAHRGGTLIYSILFSDPSYGFFDREGKSVLQRMSKETGGGYYEVSNKMPIDKVFQAIEEDLRSQYNLGYVSDRPAEVPEFRRISLTTKRPGLVVQARDRYWAEPKA